MFNNYKIPALLASIITTTTVLNNSIITLAQNGPNNDIAIFDYTKTVIMNTIQNLTIFILIPIGVLMIVINIILIIWALIAGEKGAVSGKIAGIVIGFLMVIIGIAINANKASIFTQ